MLGWAFSFLILALIAAMLGSSGVSLGALQITEFLFIAQVLFVVFLFLVLITFISGFM